MSCHAVAARSSLAPLTAILNLRGRNANSGCSVLHWRRISQYGRGSTISSAATPAKQSLVMLRMQLPLVWMPCMSTSARTSITSAASARAIQLNWQFWRVVKWPKPPPDLRTGHGAAVELARDRAPGRAAASSSARRRARRCAPSARDAARTSRSAGAVRGSRRRRARRRGGARAGRETGPRAGARSVCRIRRIGTWRVGAVSSARVGRGPESEARAGSGRSATESGDCTGR